MLGERKDAATRCVLRPIDASKCVCGPRGGSLQHSPGPLAGFGEENREGRMERVREGKGTEGEGKQWDGKENRRKGNRNWEGEFALLASEG